MWPNQKPRQDKAGTHWNFHYWNGQGQRLFFWNEEKTEFGVLLFGPDKKVPYTRIKNLILKLVADPSFRKEHHRLLEFPLKSHYEEYPVFPEELSK